MSLIKNIIKDNKSKIVDAIFDDELQEKVVKRINDNIDIPMISEKTEAKILDAIWDSVEDVVKEALIKD